ncbi:hypothetical protein DYB28_005480 [Aphanomyces astaci]|uniref:Uncharacterized protein n=1 Tax=Aphanomyces astaci TaxID=112090 RepID=A0A397B616_APHAT|nr:hypothetical protein DYB36_003525 [Aphanomyces astaci]RHY61255.1 hypothetical protein DYB34_003028 [Aphanomyces astaci]RHY63570.1 hypothetical protein DYB30_002185 [Aphanomyces astaci]RLN99328.1 hypothetical protein DYB28_005480 [Aphanomyces astaci]
MNRKIGFDNRLCYQREVARCQKIHQDKLRHIQPTSLSPAKGKLDNTTPQVHTHLKTNFKKAQMDSDKYKQIYGENQQLMRKMLKICDTSPSDAAVEFQPGMRLNTDQTPILDSFVSVQSLARGCAIDKGSMNGEYRQRQNDKIEDENRKLMQRLMTKKSCYSARKWDAEYKQSVGKFKHVHQDATVGYLSPKSRAATAAFAPYGVATTLPSLATSPRFESEGETKEDGGGGVVLSPSPPSHGGSTERDQRANSTAGCSQRSSAFIRQASKSQVPIRKAKLATIQVVPDVGNFPRVSQTLDETDLKLLLVKLVQCIRVSSGHTGSSSDSSLKLTVEHIPHLPRDLHPAKPAANSSILDLFVQGAVPSRLVLRGKSSLHLCHVRVFQLRRLLTFHAFDMRSHSVVNFQFTEEDLLPHFHASLVWTDIYRALFKLAMKRIRI